MARFRRRGGRGRPLAAFLVLLLAVAALPIEAVESLQQSFSGTSCDDSCHNGKHRAVYEELIVVDRVTKPDPLDNGDSGKVTIKFWADCDSNGGRFCDFNYVDVTLSSDNDTFDINGQATKRTGQLNAGKANAKTLEWTITGAKVGSDTLKFHLDGRNTHNDGFNIITDASELLEVVTPSPDMVLEAGSVILDPQTPVRGRNLTINVTLANKGAEGAADLALYLDGEEPGDRVGLARSLSLAENDELTISFYLETEGLFGEHTLIARAEQVDPEDKNPADNRRVVPLIILEPGNLRVDDITLMPAKPTANDFVVVNLTLANSAAYPVETTVLLNLTNPGATYSQELSIPLELVADGLTSLSREWKWSLPNPNPGISTLAVTVDPTAKVIETNETDNTATLQLAITESTYPVELQLRQSGVTFSPTTLIMGQQATINVTIYNLGYRNVTTYLTASLSASGVPALELGELALRVPGKGQISAIFNLDTFGWLGQTRLYLRASSTKYEEVRANNHLNVTFNILPPPSLTLLPGSLVIEPKPLVAGYPASLRFELTEYNLTQAEGDLYLIGGAAVPAQPFALEPGQTKEITFNFTTPKGRAHYNLLVQTPWQNLEAPFDVEGLDPLSVIMMGRVFVNPREARADEPLTVVVNLESSLPAPTPASLAVTLKPLEGGDPIILQPRNLSLGNGPSVATWTLMLPAGEYIIAPSLALELDNKSRKLAFENATFNVARANPQTFDSPAPALLLTLAGLLLGLALYPRRRLQ